VFKAILRTMAAFVLGVSLAQANANETVVVDLPHIEPIQLTFRAFDPQHVLVGERALLDGIAHHLSSKTRWPLRVGQRDTADAVRDTGGRTQVDSSRSALAIQYLAVTRYLNGASSDGTVMTMPVSYSIERTPDLVKITLTFPTQARSVRNGLPFLTRKLWDTNEIVADYSALVDSLQSVEVHLSCEAKGELESAYKQDAVLGNLERMLGRPMNSGFAGNQINAGGTVTKDGVYVYTVRGERRQVKVSTFPYHDGAKVNYAASLPYTLRSDGSSSGDDDGAQLHDLLKKIIND